MTTTDESRNTLERIVKCQETNFIVEAGAGTGKTYALCSRVVALVTTGVRMRDIVAITFTEAMAAELSVRIRSRMEQLLDDDDPANADDLLAQDLDCEMRERIQQAIAELDQAAIQTIHSFAAQLLRERPLAANLPPGWVVLDDVGAAERFEKRWDTWLEQALGEDTGPGIELQNALRYLVEEKVGIGRWRDIAIKHSENAAALRSEDSVKFNIPGVGLPAAIAGMLQELHELCDQDRNRTGESASLLDRLTAAIEVVQAAKAVSDDPAAVAKAIRGRNIGPTGNRGNQAIRRGFNEAANAFKANVITACLPEYVVPFLLDLRQKFALDYEAQRKAEGIATFDDLLVWARDLLRDDADARLYSQRRYSHILIDEFQDTDPLQAEIAFYLAAKPNEDIAGKPWHQLPLKQGKLFIVGDAKQSIYGFRGADIGVTQLVRENSEVQTLILAENRRSKQPVLDWVNDVFAQLMKDQPYQAKYVALRAHAGTRQDDVEGSVRVFGGPARTKDVTADAIRCQQASHIAQIIVDSVGENASNMLRVYDQEQGCARGARLRDISILVRGRTGLGILTRTLEESRIPYRLEGGSLIFDTQEVQDLLNCLRAIDDPTDEVSVVAALRSPAFAVSDVGLLHWKDAGGPWNYLSPLLSDAEPKDADQARHAGLQAVVPVWNAMTTIRKYHQQRRAGEVSRLVAAFSREVRLDELDLAEYRPREAWRRRRYLIEQARQLEYASATGQSASPLTLYRFIRWAELRQEENSRIAETVVPEPDDDAVRIMTIHASKGQEFPIVILLGLETDPTSWAGRGRPPVLFHPSTGTAETLVGQWDGGKGLMTPGYCEAIEVDEKRATAEMARLAYVGATRAREHLLVSLYQSELNSKNAGKVVADGIERMRASLEKDKRHFDWPVAETADSEYNTVSGVQISAPTVEYDLESWRTTRNYDIAVRSVPQAVTATRIARADASDDAELEDKDADPNPERFGRAGRGGTAFGTAVHAVLQEAVDQLVDRLPLGEAGALDQLLAELDPGIAQIAARHADGQGVLGRQDEIICLANRALRSPAVEAGLRAPRQWSEIPVAASIQTPQDPIVVEGIIDLLYQDEDGQFVILDYKSDQVDSEKDVDAKLRHYRMQGAVYAAAVEGATGEMVKAVQFLFVRRPDGLREIENLRELIERIPELMVSSTE